MKKILSLLLSLLCLATLCVGCNSKNQEQSSSKKSELTGLISEYVECIVDVQCSKVSRYASTYSATGTIDIDIKKFNTENLYFDNVDVKLVIYLSDTHGGWEFSETKDVEDWSVQGQKMTKIISLSSGGSATFSTEIEFFLKWTGLISPDTETFRRPSVSAYIYKESGRIYVQ